jgi:hypothetical protein
VRFRKSGCKNKVLPGQKISMLGKERLEKRLYSAVVNGIGTSGNLSHRMHQLHMVINELKINI